MATRPDRARGRSGRLRPPPVKAVAEELGLEVVQPGSRAELWELAASRAPFDVGVVVAFGMILEQELLDLPRAGFLNVHFSLLPRWRGAAPVAHAILAGDEETGATVMSVDAGLDTGPIVAAQPLPIDPEETAGQLTVRLADLGARLLDDVLEDWCEGNIDSVPQDEAAATWAPVLTTDAAKLDFAAPAVEVLRRIRAFNPKPGAWAMHSDRLKIWAARPDEGERTPGVGVLEIEGDLVTVGTGLGTVRLETVQPAGRRAMSAADWANGMRSDAPTTLS